MFIRTAWTFFAVTFCELRYIVVYLHNHYKTIKKNKNFNHEKNVIINHHNVVRRQRDS